MSSLRKLLPSKAKYTTLAFGEGPTEKALLKHIRMHYQTSEFHITVDCGAGGNPAIIVSKAMHHVGDFQRRFILLDIDNPWTQELEEKAKKNAIELLGADPCCLEGFLLTLLESKFKSKHSLSIKGDCKSMFHKRYLSAEAKLDYRNYEKIMPKTLLEKLRKKNAVLDQLIRFMTEIPKKFYTQS